HDDHQHGHLRHRARDRADKYAHRRGGEQMQRRRQKVLTHQDNKGFALRSA
ncbi:MAG: hypothetical protein CG438_633, partial [Methylococcaceae bacterium NSP1-1]